MSRAIRVPLGEALRRFRNLPERPCQHCGESFQPYRRDNKYCPRIACRRFAERSNARKYLPRSREVQEPNRPEHPYITATNAVQLGTLTLDHVRQTHGARFADMVAFALRERARSRGRHAA